MEEDDKARRNLMVASAAVVLVWLLDLPQKTIVSRVLGTDAGDALQLGRVWICVALVLLYLGHRYWFSGEGVAAREVLRKEYDIAKGVRVKRTLQRIASAYSKTGRESSVLSESLASYVADRMPNPFAGESTGGPAQMPRPIVTFHDHNITTADGWSGSFAIELRWGAASDSSNSQARKFRFLGWHKARPMGSSVVRVITWSESASRLFVPVGLWAVAAAITGWRLCYALVH